jgi:hypothetical protein
MMPSRETLIRAAEIIEFEAEFLRSCQLCPDTNEWNDPVNKMDHAEMLAIAAELRRAAG